MFYHRATGPERVSRADLLLSCTSCNDPFYLTVLHTGMGTFDWRAEPLDMALRKFFLEVPLPPEAQQIDRMLDTWARRYQECNPDIFEEHGKYPYLIDPGLVTCTQCPAVHNHPMRLLLVDKKQGALSW